MTLIRAFVFVSAFAVALTPIATFAQTAPTTHQQDELANGFAQWDQAQQQVTQIQDDANKSAQNERMIAVIKSEALREKQVKDVANGNALEQLAASLANAARNDGSLNAQNSLMIAQGQAAVILANVDS